MNFAPYETMVRFLSEFFGARAEIALYDASKLISVRNPFDEGRRPGDPLGDIELRFIKDKTYNNGDYVVNYRSLTKTREKLRGATIFLKEKNGDLAGLLTISLKVDRLLEARSIINELINGVPEAEFQEPAPVELFESLNVALEDHVATSVQKAVAKFGAPVDRLSPKEKRAIVKALDGKGVFLIKGSVAEVARQTASSVPTIYRYLGELTGTETAVEETKSETQSLKKKRAGKRGEYETGRTAATRPVSRISKGGARQFKGR